MIHKFINQLLTDTLMLVIGVNADGIQGRFFLENTILSKSQTATWVRSEALLELQHYNYNLPSPKIRCWHVTLCGICLHAIDHPHWAIAASALFLSQISIYVSSWISNQFQIALKRQHNYKRRRGLNRNILICWEWPSPLDGSIKKKEVISY